MVLERAEKLTRVCRKSHSTSRHAATNAQASDGARVVKEEVVAFNERAAGGEGKERKEGRGRMEDLLIL